jgi:predicted DNA-binding transcriptional regulator YafY
VNRTDRLYALVEELRARAPSPVPGPELANRFEVSLRTIERDVQALLEAGVPIWTERGRDGGYCLDRSASLPPLNLTTAEATAVVIALSALGPGPFADAARSARQKIVAVMSPRSVGELESLAARMRVAPARAAESLDPALLATVREAVERREVLDLDYEDRHGGHTRRSVEAHGLYLGDGRWALVGWCRLRDDGRVFRLDRIRAARATGERAPERDFETVLGFLPDEYRAPEIDR